MKPQLYTPTIMKQHIVHASGKSKTVCVTACLTALGVPFDSFQVTGDIFKAHYLKILQRHGMSARSRKSSVSKSIGQARKDIAKLKEDAYYFVVVRGTTYCHAMLLDNKGRTIVDTDPKTRDKRTIHSIHAVTAK